MAVLVLNAGTAAPVSLTVQQADENEPTQIGNVTPSANGADRSSVRGVKRNFAVLTSILDTTTKDAIISLLKSGAQLACSGDLLGNIQTLCSVKYTGSRMMPGLGGSFWVVALSLAEVNPSTVLLKYAPGDAITGESFTRSTVAYQMNASGVLESKAINVKRDGHYIAGVRYLLREGGRTNRIIWANDLTNAAWTKRGTVAVSLTATGPDGVVNSATSITGLGAPGTNDVFQGPAGFGATARFEPGFWLKKGSASGTVDLRNPQGAGLGQWTINLATLGAGWEWITRWHAAVTIITEFVSTAGGLGGSQLSCTAGAPVAISVWCMQNELGAFSSSPIVTTTTALSRGDDLYSLPFTQPPGETSFYESFVELGTVLTANARRFSVANAAENLPAFLCYAPSGLYTALHEETAGTGSSVLAAAPTLGQGAELASRFYGDGRADLVQSIALAAETSAASSGALAFQSAWSGQLVWLGSAGTVGLGGFSAIRSFKIVAGMRSMTELRAA